MDHPEPISKRPIDIPQCRKGFVLDEARAFIDQVMEIFRSLDNMSDLRSVYETGRQLSRAYFDCHTYRTELAQHLTNCDYPAFASKMMKKLNNMGVFKNDDIWFSSFYFYNTTWNFSDTWPEFATALATAGLPNLLNLNIGHQPYLENLSSKNVYYLIKASLSIIHNIARVPGNTHYFASDTAKQALLHLAQREEEFLRCVSTLCLAHIITESELSLITDSSNNIDLLKILFGYIGAARTSDKRRCHGFQVLDLLSALTAVSVHDPIKTTLLTSTFGEQSGNCLTLLKELVESALTPTASTIALKEAEESIRILWNLIYESSIATGGALNTQTLSWLNGILSNQVTSSQLGKAILRTMEVISWQLAHPMSRSPRSESTECGPVLLCFSPFNRATVGRIADRLRDANIPLVESVFSSEVISPNDANLVGMSMCASSVHSVQQWLECIERASVMVAFLCDSFRLSPGCRFEVEYFLATSPEAHPKPIIPVVLQPKFKTTGWLARLITRNPIDFNGKRDPEASYDALIIQLKEAYSDAKKRAEAAAATAVSTAQYQTADKKHLGVSGDIGLTGLSNVDGQMNHVNALSVTENRSPISVASHYKHEEISLHSRHSLSKICNSNMLPLNSSMVARPLATSAWRHAIRPEVRNWPASKVASWLKFRGLSHVPAQIPGGVDGILLSQLAGLRIWAPEYFTHSLRSELKLGFADSLRFLEALDELAPEDADSRKLEDGEECMDGDPHLGSLDGAASRA